MSTASAEEAVRPWTRHLVHALLFVFALTGLGRFEVFPFSGFRLFSEVRGEERKSWQIRAVDDAGEERPILLGTLPLAYRQTSRLIPSMDDLTSAARDDLCDAWARPLRDDGVEVVEVRIYEVLASVRPDGPPAERTLLYRCGADS